MTRPPSGARVFFAVLALGCGLLAACDTGGEDATPADVAGEYRFTEFRFVPDAPLLPPADLLDTLVAEQTRLQLFSSGRFTLLYQYRGAPPTFIGGDFDVSDERVRLIGHEDEARFYRALLLGTEVTLRRDGADGFVATLPRTVDLDAFSDRYDGLRSVEGTVRLQLVRR